ncbi:MAG TPA: oxidoreductase [Rhodospirillaceae bacterium]|nr:oxidoreductase [Rhodospirillaceae bacterium]
MSSPSASRSVKAQYDLTGKICVITGGAGFLGHQFAEALGEMGGLPVLFDLAPEQLEEAARDVAAYCGRCETEVADVSDEASIRNAVDRVLKRHGRIDVLINNAALTKYGCDADPDAFFAPFEDTAPEVWDAGLRINLTGTMLACKIIGHEMVKLGQGSIVNIGSDVGIVSPDQRIYDPDPAANYPGMPFNTPAFYSVTKAGVIHLTRHLATLWAANNVRVNCFSPAGVFRDHDLGFVAKLASRIPMGRMGRINEYKGAIVFLASDASSFMTGHNLVMDGGRTAW